MKNLIFVLLVFVANSTFAQKNKQPVFPKKIDKALGGLVYISGGTFYIEGDNGELIYPKEDSFLLSMKPAKKTSVNGFFMNKTETTNAQYRAFVFWVRDSVAHATLGHWMENSDGTRSIDWAQALDWTKGGTLDEFFYKAELGGEKKLDIKLLDYNFNGQNVRVYPDTLCWVRDFAYAYNKQMTRNYFHESTYNEYPVVGVSYYQASAYCHWKQTQINKILAKEGLGSVTVRLPSVAEWQHAAISTPRPRNPDELQVDKKIYPWYGIALTDEKGVDRANCGMVIDNFGVILKYYDENNPKLIIDKVSPYHLYSTLAGSFAANDMGLYDMAGNVAEWTLEVPYITLFPQYRDVEETPGLDDLRESLEKEPLDSAAIKERAARALSKAEQRKADSLEVLQIQKETEDAFYRADSLGVAKWVLDEYRRSDKKSSDPGFMMEAFKERSSFEIPNVWRDINIVYRRGEKRVAMGGSWAQPPIYMLVGSEAAYSPSDTKSWLGFRTVVVWHK